ncbi:MAG: AAA family ATPase, partial [Caldithrix sp.]|nr:AAA family ATPase [Caldithrix sp.]
MTSGSCWIRYPPLPHHCPNSFPTWMSTDMKARSVPHIFLMGKGGVGKSTVTALLSLALQSIYKRIYIISLDPAHNQADIWQSPLSQKPKKVASGVWVVQMDMEQWTDHYLKQTRQHIKAQYNYLTAFNLDKHLNVMQYAPGLHEYALMLAFEHASKTFGDADLFLFDMPPTALTMRFFNLPQLSVLWLDKLMQLRQQILQKKEVISRIQWGKKEWENDKIMNALREQKNTYQSIDGLLHDTNTSKIMLVVNPDLLSVSESVDIKNKLVQLNLSIKGVLLNKTTSTQDTAFIQDKLSDKILIHFPIAANAPIGINNLNLLANNF